MHNTTFPLTLLALFSSAEKAAEIEGDLLEQSRSKGRLWFWLHLKLTCIALFLHGLRQEPGKLLLFSYATYELVLKLNWWALRPMRFELRRALDSLVPLVTINDGVSMVAGFCVGMLIVRAFGKFAGQILILTILFFLGRVVVLESVLDALQILFWGGGPAVLGGLLMKWLLLRQEQNLQHTPV